MVSRLSAHALRGQSGRWSLVAAFTATLIALGSPDQGFAADSGVADSSTGALVRGHRDFESAVDESFTRMERVMRSCVIGREGRNEIDVRYLGIPKGDPRLSPSLRDAINSRVVAAINRISPYVANPYEVNELLPSLVPGTPIGGQSLLSALNEQAAAPMVVIIEPSRPTADVLTLKIQMLGRGRDGTYGCPQQRLLHVDITSLDPVSRPSQDLDLREFNGFLDSAFGQMIKSIRSAESLYFDLAGADENRCAELRNLLVRSRARYYNFRRNLPERFITDDVLPGLMDASSEKAEGAHVFSLRLEPVTSNPGVYAANLRLSKATTDVDAAFSHVTLQLALPKECFDAPDPSPEDIAGIDPGTAPADPGTQAPATDAPAFEPGTGCIRPTADSPEDEPCLEPGEIFADCEGCPDVAVVPPGQFVMGSPENEKGRGEDEGPQQTITLSRPMAFRPVRNHQVAVPGIR